MKKIIKLVFALFLLQGTLLFAQQKVTLKVATVAPANSPWDVELKKLAAEWVKITNGEVRIQFQNMTAIGGEKAGIQRMTPRRPGQRAILDGAIFTSIGLNEVAPKARIFTLSIPFLIRTQAELELVIKNFGAEIEAEYNKAGVQLLAWTNAGWIRFYTKNNYSDLSGLKRQRIICSGFDSPALSNALKIAGFSVSDMPSNKISTALKTGAADGIYSVPMLAYLTGDFKNLNYGLDTRLCPVMAGFVMSNESWKLVPAKYHADLKASMQRTIEKLNAELETFDVDYTRRMTNQGLKLIRLTSEQTRTWDKLFTEDMKRASARYPDLFNVNLYKNIQDLLEKNRK
ncbi:MAG: TRAP transporter substrate-binding protein DctP [Treponemataceae bacterium]